LRESETAAEDCAGARRGGSGRKLHDDEGRAETRVKISEIRRCWTAVSCGDGSEGCIDRYVCFSWYQLCVELGQTRLAIVIENQDGVDHCCCLTLMCLCVDRGQPSSLVKG